MAAWPHVSKYTLNLTSCECNCGVTLVKVAGVYVPAIAF